jgi:hypothetical protein
VQVDHAAVEAVEGDVAAILRHGRAHARVQQRLDLAHDLAVFAVMLRMAAGGLRLAVHHRVAGLEMLHDRAENGGLQVVPFHRSPPWSR